LVAPSANPFGYVSPTTAQHVADRLGDRVPYVLDGGPSAVGIESTIVGWEAERPVVYRLGGLPLEKVEALLGERPHVRPSTSNPQAPGMLLRHYAPRVPFRVGDLEVLLSDHNPTKVAVLSLRSAFAAVPAAHQVQLSPTGDLRTAAARLFAAMRALDALPVEVILAEWMPDEGLGRAVNDRLRRAAWG
ncbi:MAG: Sua5 family C-terminal domain-containing protein, partial [Catalinimonas sp.]